MKKKDIILVIVVFFVLILFDYINLPAILGFKISNINFDFWLGLLNIIVVVVLYIITYKRLDERAILREKNKNEISVLLIRECYRECIKHIEFLTQEVVEKYIVPKMDFNSTNNKNTIISNLQNSPFENENTIMELVKDGQVTNTQIEEYFRIKNKYRNYINMRITLFDGPHIYQPLKNELSVEINKEIKNIDNKM